MKKDTSQNPTKSFKNQILGIFFTHVKSVFVISIIGLFLIGSLLVMNVVGKILSVLLLLSYGLILYSAAYECASYDLKTYTKTKAYIHKGIYLSLLIPLSNLIMWLIMKLLWTIEPQSAMPPEMGFEMVWWPQIPGAKGLPWTAFLGNILFVIWTFPYNEFMNIQDSYISTAGHILMYVFPVICVSIGYVAGYKKWDISSKFTFLVYEKKKDEKSQTIK